MIQAQINIKPAEIEHDMTNYVECLGTVRAEAELYDNGVRIRVVDDVLDPKYDVYFLVVLPIHGHLIINQKNEIYELECNISSGYDRKSHKTIDIGGDSYHMHVKSPQKCINMAQKILILEAVRQYIEELNG